MGVNRDKSVDVSETITARQFRETILPTLSDNDVKLRKTIIDEVNGNGYYIQYLFQLSWMDKEDYIIIDDIIMKYALQFERRSFRNGLIQYLGKKGNIYATDFLLGEFCKKNGEHETGILWNDTIRAATSSALEVIRDKSRVDDYLQIIDNEETRRDSYFIILLLGELRVEKSIPLLIKLLNENNINNQAAAIKALTYFKRKIDIKQLASPFINSENEVLREYAKKAMK